MSSVYKKPGYMRIVLHKYPDVDIFLQKCIPALAVSVHVYRFTSKTKSKIFVLYQ